MSTNCPHFLFPTSNFERSSLCMQRAAISQFQMLSGVPSAVGACTLYGPLAGYCCSCISYIRQTLHFFGTSSIGPQDLKFHARSRLPCPCAQPEPNVSRNNRAHRVGGTPTTTAGPIFAGPFLGRTYILAPMMI